MSNSYRSHLVTVFACATCGNALTLSYDEEGKTRRASSEGEPTGAAMVRNVIAVEPCQACLRPGRDLQDAVATLLQVAAPTAGYSRAGSRC